MMRRPPRSPLSPYTTLFRSREPGPRPRRRQSIRLVGLPADHPSRLALRGAGAFLDARAVASPVRLGADHFRDRRAPGLVAVEPARHGIADADAGGAAADAGDPDPLQERSAEAARADAEALQGAQDQPVRRLLPDAAADARAAGLVLRVYEFDRVSRRAVPLASRSRPARTP